MPAPIAAAAGKMLAKKAMTSKSGRKTTKNGCIAAALIVILPVFMMLALISVFVNALLHTTGVDCSGGASGTTGVTQTDADVAAGAINDAGVTNINKTIVMTAIAGAQSGFNITTIKGNAYGLWGITKAADPADFPPQQNDDKFLLQEDTNAAAAVSIAGGPSLPSLSFWKGNEAYEAFANAGGVKTVNGKTTYDWSVAGTVADGSGFFAQARTAVTDSGISTPTAGPSPSGGASASATADTSGDCCGADSSGGGGGDGGSLSQNQTAYARMIIGIAKTMNVGSAGELIALMVASDESHFQEYANSNVPSSLSYPHDAVGSDHGSVGIFQQQVNPDGSNFGWGTLQQLMNPTDGIEYQAYRFVNALKAVGGWQSMEPWVAAQAVQKSGTSSGMNYYAQMGTAQAILAANGDAPAIPLPAGATDASGSGGAGGAYCSGNASTQAIQAAADALDALNWMYCQPAAGYSTPSVFIHYPGDGLCASPGGLDCAGTVGYVLQHAGMSTFTTQNSTGYMGLPWQKLGSSQWPLDMKLTTGVQLYASVEHTFLVINGKVFSSDTEHSPTGGPHWRTWTPGDEESGDNHSDTWVAFQVPGTS